MSPSPDSSAPETPSPEAPRIRAPPPCGTSSGRSGPRLTAPASAAPSGTARILSVVVALVLALGGGGIWALTRSSDPLSMVTAPILQAQQDLSNIG